jgi:hypothetical protein
MRVGPLEFLDGSFQGDRLDTIEHREGMMRDGPVLGLASPGERASVRDGLAGWGGRIRTRKCRFEEYP